MKSLHLRRCVAQLFSQRRTLVGAVVKDLAAKDRFDALVLGF